MPDTYYGTGNTAAGALTGTETLSVVRAGALVDTTTQAIADLGGGGGGTNATNLATTVAASTVTVTSDTGTDAVIPAATATDAGVMSAADRVKLDGIAAGAQVNVAPPVDIIIALGDETTAITTGTAKVTIRAPRAMTLTKIKASLSTAGSDLSAFDVNKNGVSLFTTTVTIDASEKTSETAATAAVLATTAIAADDELTFDIDTAGAAAAGAKITLVGVAA